MKYCPNCAYKLAPEIEAKEPNVKQKKYLLEKDNKKKQQPVYESEEEQDSENEEQTILEKLASKIVIKKKPNGSLDVRKKVSDKQNEQLLKAREARSQKIKAVKEQGENYRYNKKKEQIEELKSEPEPEPVKQPVKSKKNINYNLF
jgi:hypothetical protein